MIYFVELNDKKYEVEVSDNTAVIFNKTQIDADENQEEPINSNHISLNYGDAHDANMMKAEMPGTILSVEIKKGDYVDEGDVILVFESMKMENEIVAHKNGYVREVYIKIGDRIAIGDYLIRIE